jgi:murein tripeptide amidase MpaA
MRFAYLLVLALPLMAQTGVVPPMPPQSKWVTPAMTAAQSLAESTAKANPTDRLTAETSNYADTGSYEEALSFCKRLAARFPAQARVIEFGRTAENRPLVILALSKDGAFTPEAAKRTGKNIVLLQNGIHPGEVGGKDASLMLARDILVSKRFAKWLDQSIILILPVFNADGHENRSLYHRINQNGPRETGFRATAQRLNLNRDYMKADAPEMKAWLKMYNRWLPDFLVDNHVTDGQDAQYDVTIDVPVEGPVSPEASEWAKHYYVPFLNQEMKALGHIIGPYVPQMIFSPRYSQGYAALRNRQALLVETHSLKPYRVQVWSHYDIMRITLDAMGEFGKDLKQAVVNAEKNDGDGQQKAWPVDWKLGGEAYTHQFLGLKSDAIKSELSGGTYAVYQAEPLEIPIKWYPHWEPVSVDAPLRYVIPQAWNSVAETLRLHGVKVDVAAKDSTVEANGYRLMNPKWSAAPFEGRHMVEFSVEALSNKLRIAAGDFVVDMKQPNARVAHHLLEPAGVDSLVKWGTMNAIFERKEYFSAYVFEPIAAAMLQQNPEIKARFEAKLKAEPAFAQSPAQRLNWLYEQSPYAEKTRGLYPILRQ